MRITITLEVESREALATILRTGAEQSLCNYKVIGFHFSPPLTPVGLGHTTEDYRNAPNGIGPLANEWKDKPHRLVYDLCRKVERLTAAPESKATRHKATIARKIKSAMAAKRKSRHPT